MTGLAIPSVGLKGELDQLDQLDQLLFLAELCSEKKLGPGLGHFFSTGVERRVRRPCQELPGSFDRSESNPALHRFWMEYRSGRFWSRTVPHSTPRRPQQIDGFKTNSQF